MFSAMRAPLRALAADFFFLLALTSLIFAILQLSLGPLPGVKWIPSPLALALNYLVILFPLSAGLILFSRRQLALGSLALALVFAFTNHLKIHHLREPIALSDFFNLQISPLMLSFVGWPETSALAVLVVLLLSALYFFWCNRQRKIGGSFLLFGLLNLVFLGVFAVNGSFFPQNWLQRKFPANYGPIESYRVYGYALQFLFNASELKISPPTNYSAETITRLLPPSQLPDPSDSGGGTSDRPDIVVVLLESFSDLRAANLSFKKDFLPNYRKLNGQNLPLISPVVGGGTANAEFELLLGIPIFSFPGATVPYNQYLNTKCPRWCVN